MKFVLINGSSRKGRKSIHVSRFIASLIEKQGNHSCDLLDVAEYKFPIMEERLRFLEELPEGMREFSDKLSAADGIIIVSPEYNGSYPGVLKNTLDYFKPEYEQKPMALVTVSEGRMGGANAMHHLQAWAIHVKGILSPYKLYVSRVDEKFNPDGQLIQGEFAKSAELFLSHFYWLAAAIQKAGKK